MRRVHVLTAGLFFLGLLGATIRTEAATISASADGVDCHAEESEAQTSFAAVAAATFDAVDDFSTTTNSESSTWSYRVSDDLTRSGNYTLLPDISDLMPSWDPTTLAWNDGSQPNIGVNNTGSSITFIENPNTFLWPDNTLWMHPAPTRLAVLSWLSPADGEIDIAFSFADMDPNGVSPFFGDGISWFVDRNDAGANLASGVIAEAGPPTGLMSINDVAVAAGDRINFIVAPNGNYSFDSTAVTATIHFVPEPYSVLLLVAGIGTLLLRRGGRRECR